MIIMTVFKKHSFCHHPAGNVATSTAPLCKVMDGHVTWEAVVSCSDEDCEQACNGLTAFAQTYLQEGR